MTETGGFATRVRAYLAARHSPRWEMAILLAASGFMAFVASVGLYRLGVTNMVWRYSASTLVGYATFLVAARVLIFVYEDGVSSLNLRDARVGHACASDESDLGYPRGRGGDLSEMSGCMQYAFVAALLGLVCVCAFMVAVAPVLLADLLLDSLVVGGIYRSTRRATSVQWFVDAGRRTIGPFFFLLGSVTLLAMGIGYYAPRATTVVEAFHDWRETGKKRAPRPVPRGDELAKELTAMREAVLRDMREFLTEHGGAFNEQDVQQCGIILKRYQDRVAKAADRVEALKHVRETVLALNELDRRAEDQLIERREETRICALILLAGRSRGFFEDGEPVTEEWREW